MVIGCVIHGLDHATFDQSSIIPELADGVVLDLHREETDLGVGGALGEVPVLEVDHLLRVAVRVAATVFD